MHTLKRNAIVPYTTRQMFELVNSVEEYPHFLPWCQKSQVISRTDDVVVASLDVNWKGIHRSFTTKNQLYPYERVEITLVNGPLQRLDGIWCFYPLNDKACKITLDLEFEFTGHFIDKLFQPVFSHIANTLVDAFCKRAVLIYGYE